MIMNKPSFLMDHAIKRAKEVEAEEAKIPDNNCTDQCSDIPFLVRKFLDNPEFVLIETFDEDVYLHEKLRDIEPLKCAVLIYFNDRADKKYYTIEDIRSANGENRLDITIAPITSNGYQNWADELEEEVAQMKGRYAEDPYIHINDETAMSLPSGDSEADPKSMKANVTRGKVYTNHVEIATIFAGIIDYPIFKLDGHAVYAADLAYDEKENTTVIKCAKAGQAVEGDYYAVDMQRLITDVHTNFTFVL